MFRIVSRRDPRGILGSPVHANGKIYLTNDDGQTFVVEAGRQFKLLKINELGERTLASPALVDGTWYWRTAGSLAPSDSPA